MWNNWELTGETKVLSILSTTNHTQPDLGLNPGWCGESLVTNSLRYGMAIASLLLQQRRQ
jgi:hypothetical protein